MHKIGVSESEEKNKGVEKNIQKHNDSKLPKFEENTHLHTQEFQQNLSRISAK